MSLYEAARVLTEMFGSEELGSHVGTHMTCMEAEAMAAVMREFGDPDAAAAFLLGHAEDDDEGDLHYALIPETERD